MAKLFKFPGASAPAPASSTAATAAAAVPDATAAAAGQPGANTCHHISPEQSSPDHI